ncbi:hypothetical protein ACWDG1_49980 [Streptomyces sp. NPDC001177]
MRSGGSGPADGGGTPQGFGASSTVPNRFRQRRDAGVFEALLEGLIAEAAQRGEVGLSLVSFDSTTTRDHRNAAAMHVVEEVLGGLEKAAAEAAKARSKGAASKNKTDRTPRPIPGARRDDASDVGENSD